MAHFYRFDTCISIKTPRSLFLKAQVTLCPSNLSQAEPPDFLLSQGGLSVR